MRIATFGCFMLCLVAGNAAAQDVYVFEPHALLYYQVVFAGRAQDRKSSFGVRLDQTRHVRDESPDFRELISRPAVAEFRFNSDGVHSLNIAGTDFAEVYRLHRAAENGAAAEQPAAGGAAEPEAKPDESKESGKEDGEKKSIGDYLDAAPAGYLIGAAIGVVLLTNVGD